MGKKELNERQRRGRKKQRLATTICFLGFSTILGFGPISLLISFGLASALGKLIGTMAEGLDLTTHNKEDEERRRQEEELKRLREEEARRQEEEARRKAEAMKLPLCGDPVADEIIKKGQETLHAIREANDAIPDVALSNQMDELERLCYQMFRTIADKPAKAPQIRKFMNYYLPTTLKMLGSYRLMQDRGVSTTDMVEARATLIRGMNMVLTACQKQLDNLFKDDMLDVSTDIDVLEQMLKRDGFIDGGLGNVQPGPAARTAASAQLDAGTPTINVQKPAAPAAPAREPEQFRSFYTKN